MQNKRREAGRTGRKERRGWILGEGKIKEIP